MMRAFPTAAGLILENQKGGERIIQKSEVRKEKLEITNRRLSLMQAFR